MTFEELERIARRVTIKNPPFPIVMWVEKPRMMPDTLVGYFYLSWCVPDRDTREERRIGSGMPVPDVWDETTTLRAIEDRIRHAFEHEFQECFHVDGVRVRDPHAPIKVASGRVVSLSRMEGV